MLSKEHPFPTLNLGYKPTVAAAKARRPLFRYPIPPKRPREDGDLKPADTCSANIVPPADVVSDVTVTQETPKKEHTYAKPFHCDCTSVHCLGCHDKLHKLKDNRDGEKYTPSGTEHCYAKPFSCDCPV